MDKRLTLRTARERAALMGCTLTSKPSTGEYRVALRHGTEASASYETDLQSALDTAAAMSAFPALQTPQGEHEYAIISADRPVEYGTLDGNTIRVRV